MNTTQYFTSTGSPDEIRSAYRNLALRYHPDRPGGDLRTMQEINRQHEAALQSLNGRTYSRTDARTHKSYSWTYEYQAAQEQDIRDAVARFFALKLEGVTLYIAGTWLWAEGDTRPVKEQLKAAKFIWHAKRVMWYWHPEDSRSRYNSRVDPLVAYGAREIDEDKDRRQALAGTRPLPI